MASAPKKSRRTRGSGEILQLGPESFAIRWRQGNRKRYKAGYTSREDARRALQYRLGILAISRRGLPADDRSAPAVVVLGDEWLEDDRKLTNPDLARRDKADWENHLRDKFENRRPGQVDRDCVHEIVKELRKTLKPDSVRCLVSRMSMLWKALAARQLVVDNPWLRLPERTAALVRSDYDPKTTPFIESLADIQRVYRRLLAEAEQLAVAFAIGVMAGLRTGEVLALEWTQVNLVTKRAHLVKSVKKHGRSGVLKGGDSRVVPLQDGLVEVLKWWKLRSGGSGLVVKPLHPRAKYMDGKTANRHLRVVLDELGLLAPFQAHIDAHAGDSGRDWPGMLWYWCTRHTFASQMVMAGRSMEEVSRILGHSSVIITERHYVHLKPDFFRPGVTEALGLSFSRDGGDVRRLPAAEPPPGNGQSMGSKTASAGRKGTKSRRISE